MPRWNWRWPVKLLAQNTTADVVGTVTDASGAVVPNATVVLTDVNTHETRTLKSGSSGEFTFTLLKPSTYSLSATAAGFKTFQVESFNLATGDRAREDAHLDVGASGEVVTIEAAPPRASVRCLRPGQHGYRAGHAGAPPQRPQRVQPRPDHRCATEGLNNGLASGNRPDDRRPTSSVSVNGQADVINNQLIDGMDNNERVIGSIGVRPSVDAIQEVNIQTNTFTAESGRSAGAIINIITKSGTNQLHGTAYEFFRNDALNANPFKFGALIPKPHYRQNQFGGSIGGPILKDRTFFFGDYEGLRLARGLNPTSTTVPTLFERNNPGNFIDNPAINLVETPTDKAGLAYFNLFPLPTNTALANNFTASPTNTQVGDTADGRVDHRFSPTDFGYVRYTFNRLITNVGALFPNVTVGGIAVSPGGNLGSYAGPAKSLAHQVQFNYIHTFTPNLLVELKAGYTFLNNFQNPLGFGTAPNASFGQPNINFSPRTDELSPVTISQGATLGAHPPIVYLENTWQYDGAVSWTHGKQTIKIGGGVIRRQDTTTQTDSASGSWTIANFATLLTGTYTSLSRNDILFQPHNRTWEPHVYLQDDWRVAPNLTLNLGVRYDLYTPYTDTNNILSNFDTNVGKIVVAGTPGVDGHGNVKVDYTNFAPRLGFAYTPAPKTVIRGGFGLSFAPENLTSGSALVNQPFNATIGPCSTTTPCAPGFVHFADGIPVPVANSATNPSGSVSAALDPNFKSTYIEQFNLTAEREFLGNVATISYVGELGRRLAYYLPDVNEERPNAEGVIDNTLRPYYGTSPGVTGVPLFTSKGASSYNALQAVLKRRISRGIDFQFTYTYAHNLDDSETISNDGGDGFGAVPSLVSQIEYGNANLDVRHRFSAAFNYAFPGNSLNGLRGVVAKGWQFNGIIATSTGLPFSVTNLANRTGNRPGTAGTDRPNQIANPNLSGKSVLHWFNTAAFVGQTVGTIGNERRDQISGPGLERVDLSLFKNFPIYERLNMEFRTEAFNVMNTAQFAFPNASFGNAAFGTIAATNNAYNPRILQFAVRFKF